MGSAVDVMIGFVVGLATLEDLTFGTEGVYNRTELQPCISHVDFDISSSSTMRSVPMPRDQLLQRTCGFSRPFRFPQETPFSGRSCICVSLVKRALQWRYK